MWFWSFPTARFTSHAILVASPRLSLGKACECSGNPRQIARTYEIQVTLTGVWRYISLLSGYVVELNNVEHKLRRWQILQRIATMTTLEF